MEPERDGGNGGGSPRRNAGIVALAATLSAAAIHVALEKGLDALVTRIEAFLRPELAPLCRTFLEAEANGTVLRGLFVAEVVCACLMLARWKANPRGRISLLVYGGAVGFHYSLQAITRPVAPLAHLGCLPWIQLSCLTMDCALLAAVATPDRSRSFAPVQVAMMVLGALLVVQGDDPTPLMHLAIAFCGFYSAVQYGWAQRDRMTTVQMVSWVVFAVSLLLRPWVAFSANPHWNEAYFAAVWLKWPLLLDVVRRDSRSTGEGASRPSGPSAAPGSRHLCAPADPEP